MDIVLEMHSLPERKTCLSQVLEELAIAMSQMVGLQIEFWTLFSLDHQSE